MFEKLISNIPYNPSLVENLVFYTKRIKSEKSIRKIGFIFIVLGFLIQFLIIYSPPTPTLADSPNDLVNGGFNSATSAAADCNSNVGGYQVILANYGINCSMVANAPTVNLNSDSYDKQLWSMGRLSYPSIQGNEPININGTTFYIRYLWGWDTGANVTTGSYYHALEINVGSKTYFLLYACGNLVSIGPPVAIVTPPPTTTQCPSGTTGTYPNCNTTQCPSGTTGTYPNCITPAPCESQISTENPYACLVNTKSAINLTEDNIDANNTTAQAGDIIQYTLSAKNVGNQMVANYVFSDNLSYVLDYSTINNISNNGQLNSQNNTISWPAINIDPGQTHKETFSVKIDNPIPQTPASTSDPNYYNLTMENTFGNNILIKLPASPQKIIENVTAPTALPNTGPGTDIFISSIFVIIAGFFFYRNRLLVKESEIIIKETTGI